MATSGTNYTGKWSLNDGVLTISPKSGTAGTMRPDGYTLAGANLLNYISLTTDEIESVRSIVFEKSINLHEVGFMQDYFERKDYKNLLMKDFFTLDFTPAFPNLETVDITGLQTSSMESAMIFPSPIENVIGLNNLETKKCTNYNYIFNETKISEIDISQWDMDAAESRYLMFGGSTTQIVKIPTLEAGANTYENRQINIAFEKVKATNENGITIHSDEDFWKLPATERGGTWTREYNAQDFKLVVTNSERSESTVTINLSYETTAAASLSLFVKRKGDAAFPSTASYTKDYSVGAGTDTVSLTVETDEAYDVELIFSDGATNLYTFVDIDSNQLLIEIDDAGNLTTIGSVTASGNMTACGTKLVWEAGDSYTISGDIQTAGYVTTSSKSVRFIIPLNKPVASEVTGVTISNLKLTLRQGGKYTHGSSATSGVTPASIDAALNDGFITVKCTMSSTTNAVNNDTIGISTSEGGAKPTITFS